MNAAWIDSPTPGEGPAILELARQHSLTRPLPANALAKFWETAQDEGQAAGYHFLVSRPGAGQAPAACVCYGPRPLTRGTYDIHCLAGVAPESGDSAPEPALHLLQHLAQAMRECGGRLLLAEASSLPAYAPARNLWMAAGFTPEVTVPDFYHPGDDLVILTRHLSTPSCS